MEEFDVAIVFDVSIFQLFFLELWLINLEIVFWSSNELIHDQRIQIRNPIKSDTWGFGVLGFAN